MIKKHKGTVSIHRWTGTSSGVEISVVDGASRVEILRLQMTIEAFGAAVTGLSCQPCNFESHTHYLGKLREHKIELIRVPSDLWNLGVKTRNAKIRALVAKHEVDGWMGQDEDAMNHHRIDPETGKYLVMYVRYVDPANEEN